MTGARYGITLGAACDFPGAEDRDEAWLWAREIELKVAAVLDGYGVRNARPLVNVWDRGDGGPIID